MKESLNVSSRNEIKAAVTIQLCDGCFNYFKGDIRNGNRYARVSYYYNKNKLKIKVTYWEDGNDIAVDFASFCSTATGLVNKVAKFLNVK